MSVCKKNKFLKWKHYLNTIFKFLEEGQGKLWSDCDSNNVDKWTQTFEGSNSNFRRKIADCIYDIQKQRIVV